MEDYVLGCDVMGAIDQINTEGWANYVDEVLGNGDVIVDDEIMRRFENDFSEIMGHGGGGHGGGGHHGGGGGSLRGGPAFWGGPYWWGGPDYDYGDSLIDVYDIDDQPPIQPIVINVQPEKST